MPPTPRRTSSRHLSRSVVPTRACARATNGSLAPAEVDLTAPSSCPATSPRSAIAYVPSFEVVDTAVGQVSNIHTFPGNRTRGNRIVKRTSALGPFAHEPPPWSESRETRPSGAWSLKTASDYSCNIRVLYEQCATHERRRVTESVLSPCSAMSVQSWDRIFQCECNLAIWAIPLRLLRARPRRGGPNLDRHVVRALDRNVRETARLETGAIEPIKQVHGAGWGPLHSHGQAGAYGVVSHDEDARVVSPVRCKKIAADRIREIERVRVGECAG